MGMSIRTKNILTALLAVVLVGGFVFLAEGLKSDDKDDRLEAIENATTTTVRRTTTTRKPTTTTSSTIALSTTSTSTAAVTATTVRKTTTTRASTTATTRRTTTTAAPGPSGPSREASSNEVTLVHNSDGTFATASSDPGPARPFAFTVKSCVIPTPGSDCATSGGGASGDSMQVRFTVTVKNNTSRTISFGDDGLTIDVALQNPNGTTSQFVMNATSEKSLAPGAGLAISSTTSVTGIGSFKWTAACDIDFGS